MEWEILLLQCELSVLQDAVSAIEHRYKVFVLRVHWAERLRRQNFAELLYRREFHPCIDCLMQSHSRINDVFEFSRWDMFCDSPALADRPLWIPEATGLFLTTAQVVDLVPSICIDNPVYPMEEDVPIGRRSIQPPRRVW